MGLEMIKPNCYGEGNKCQLYKGCPTKRGKVDISFLDVFHLYFKIFLIDLQVLILQVYLVSNCDPSRQQAAYMILVDIDGIFTKNYYKYKI